MKPLRVAHPCEVPWSEMSPVAGGRHCATCDRDVVDVSRLTKTELLRVLQASTSLCVRQRVAPDGELVLAAPPRPAGPVRPAAVAALAALVAAGPARAGAPVEAAAVAEAAAEAGEEAAPVQTRVKTEIHFEDQDLSGGYVTMGVLISDGDLSLPSIDFDPVSARMPDSGHSVLSYIAAVMAQEPNLKQIALRTHVAPGEKPKLARRRLEAVRDGLVSLGVPRDAITLTIAPDGGRDPRPGRVDLTLCDETCEGGPTSVR